MVATRNPKSKKYRGSKTHGCGSMKKRRGAGNRGGRGNAGSGKKGDAKAPTLWKTGQKHGKFGFKNACAAKAIGITALERKLDTYLKDGKIKNENNTFLIDLNTLGFDKLTGNGTVSKNMTITAKSASKTAISKIKEFGGDVKIPE